MNKANTANYAPIASVYSTENNEKLADLDPWN